MSICIEVHSIKINELSVDDDGFTLMENFVSTKTDIIVKNHHAWVCPVHVLDEILQVNVSVITMWEHHSN